MEIKTLEYNKESVSRAIRLFPDLSCLHGQSGGRNHVEPEDLLRLLELRDDLPPVFCVIIPPLAPFDNYYNGNDMIALGIDVEIIVDEISPELTGDRECPVDVNSVQLPRSLRDILEAEHFLGELIWAQNIRMDAENCLSHPVNRNGYSLYVVDRTLGPVRTDISTSTEPAEDEVGVENLLAWDDYERGFINGKLSALRWVLGDDWDKFDS